MQTRQHNKVKDNHPNDHKWNIIEKSKNVGITGKSGDISLEVCQIRECIKCGKMQFRRFRAGKFVNKWENIN